MKISVALCTYNGQQFLLKQIESIFFQSFSVDEIIICDDNSTDNTISIISGFLQKYPEIIKLYINKNNLGIVRNFQKAISLCSGDVIFLCDQDDIWKKDKVEKTSNFFDENPLLYAVFSNADLINEFSLSLSKTLWDSLLFKGTVNIFRHLLFYRNVVTGACLTIKKETLKLILPFPEKGKMLHDEWIALKLSKVNKIGFINIALVEYRVHNNQKTGLPRENFDADYKIIREAIFNDEASVYPLYYYYHWRHRLELIHSLKKDYLISVDNILIKEMNEKLKKGLFIYFKKMPVVKRKITLLKWLIKNKGVSINELINL